MESLKHFNDLVVSLGKQDLFARSQRTSAFRCLCHGLGEHVNEVDVLSPSPNSSEALTPDSKIGMWCITAASGVIPWATAILLWYQQHLTIETVS